MKDKLTSAKSVNYKLSNDSLIRKHPHLVKPFYNDKISRQR